MATLLNEVLATRAIAVTTAVALLGVPEIHLAPAQLELTKNASVLQPRLLPEDTHCRQADRASQASKVAETLLVEALPDFSVFNRVMKSTFGCSRLGF